MFIWTYSVLAASAPLMGWGKTTIEGNLLTCSYDYLTKVRIYAISLKKNVTRKNVRTHLILKVRKTI